MWGSSFRKVFHQSEKIEIYCLLALLFILLIIHEPSCIKLLLLIHTIRLLLLLLLLEVARGPSREVIIRLLLWVLRIKIICLAEAKRSEILGFLIHRWEGVGFFLFTKAIQIQEVVI